MKKRQGKKFLTMILVSALTVSLLSGSYTNVSEAEASVRYATDVDTPTEGCVLVGVKGSFIVDAQSALDRINEIRLEACQEGIIDQHTGVALTEADYVPIKWSSDLEYIAKIRAVEASVYLAHTRTNGKDCFSLYSPGGQHSWGEVLAWNWEKTMISGIEQWYDEKEDWVNQKAGAMTGHYTQMINPANLYVGLADFYSSNTEFPNTVSGEFSSKAGAIEDATESVDDCIQIIEAKSDYLSDVFIQGDATLSVGQEKKLEVQGTLSCDSDVAASTTTVFLEADWESSNRSVVTVDDEGKITGEAVGEATITATLQDGTRLTFSVSVAENEVTASPDNTSGSSDTPAPEGQETIPPDSEESSKPGTGETTPPEGQESSKPGIGEIIPPSSKPGTSEIPSPSIKPSASPSARPSASPTTKPSATPTIRPTIQPTAAPVSTATAGKWKNPSGTSLKKLKPGKKMVTVTWKKAKDTVVGYELQLATNKSFTKGKKTRVMPVKKYTSVKICNLKARKKYYFRIRTYRTLSGEQIYSKWSKVKAVKTK